MAAVTVAFNGTRVNASDSGTNWSNLVGGGPAPAAESPIAYQGGLAVNRKVNATSLTGIQYDPGAGALDMTAAANRLWFVKCIASDSFDLNTTEGARLSIGSASNAFYAYNIAGSGANNPRFLAWPPQGGYRIFSLDPNIAAWREATTGSPALTAVDWFACQWAFIVGAAKAENVALDAIDVGTGLTLTRGDGADADGTFVNFVTTDQDNTSNRWGVVVGSGNNVRGHGLLTIGASGTATEFLDTASVVVFPDGYHSRGLVGVRCDIQNASTTIEIASLLIGEGTRNGVDANDTRPDFTVVGTAGAFTFRGTMRNHRDVTFTSVCDVFNFDLSAFLLVQASANISAGIIRTTSLTNVATLQDPTFGTTTDLRDVEFIQAGAGHAIEIDTPGTYDFQDLTFTGYGGTPGTNGTPSSGAADAAVYNSSGGAVTINVNGAGNSPSVRNAAGSTTTVVAGAVTLTVKCVTQAGTPIQNVRVRVVAKTPTGPLTDGTVLIDGVLTNASGEASDTRVYSSNQDIVGVARKASPADNPKYQQGDILGTISSTSGLTVTVVMIPDE